jgi:hypothetical protein
VILRFSAVGVVTVNFVKSRADLWNRLTERLSWPGWLGLGAMIAAAGVIIATGVTLLSIFLSSGSGTSNNVHGNCDATGIGNTSNCPSVSPGRSR